MADRRVRPGSLIVGMVFLLVGGLAVVSDLTTLDASWILPVALLAAGVSGLILIAARIRRATDPVSTDFSGFDPQ